MDRTNSQNDNGAQFDQNSSIPSVPIAGQREAAAERRKAFPYRFPRDSRLMGGKFSVAENARRLRRFFYFERRLMQALDRKSTRLNSSHVKISYAVFCLKKKKIKNKELILDKKFKKYLKKD